MEAARSAVQCAASQKTTTWIIAVEISNVTSGKGFEGF